MGTNSSPHVSDEIRPHRQSFDVPAGFNRTTDPPCQTQQFVTDVFIYRSPSTEIVGYVVVKRLHAQDDVFWSTEEYRNNGRYQKQQNSYGTAQKSDVPEHISRAASNIRSHTIPTK